MGLGETETSIHTRILVCQNSQIPAVFSSTVTTWSEISKPMYTTLEGNSELIWEDDGNLKEWEIYLALKKAPWGSKPLMRTDPLWKVGRRKCLELNVSFCLQCPTLGHSLCFLNDTWWTSFRNRQGLCSSSMFKMQIALVFQLTLRLQRFMSTLKGQNNKKKCCWMEKEW